MWSINDILSPRVNPSITFINPTSCNGLSADLEALKSFEGADSLVPYGSSFRYTEGNYFIRPGHDILWNGYVDLLEILAPAVREGLVTELSLDISTTLAMCEEANTPRSLTIALLIQSEQWYDLTNLVCNPDMYLDYRTFRIDKLLTKVLQKNSWLPVGIDKATVALVQSALVDQSLEKIYHPDCFDNTELGLLVDKVGNTLVNLLKMGKRNLMQKNGVQCTCSSFLCSHSLAMIEDSCKHGPGSTFLLRGTLSEKIRGSSYKNSGDGKIVPVETYSLSGVLVDKTDHGANQLHLKFRNFDCSKHDRGPSVTADLEPFTRSLLGETGWYASLPPVIVPGNRITTVPKDCKTDRLIAVEPTINQYLQQGIGIFLSDVLKTLGVDIHDQSKNQDLARRAYDEQLCTLDLSSASDSIATPLVYQLLTQGGRASFVGSFYNLLNLARSKVTQYTDSETRELTEPHKRLCFSSMGNGFTFPLETLIFLAVARTNVPRGEWHRSVCYGDDIIVPRSSVHGVIYDLEKLGFKINLGKSFIEGNFYESCGKDFFMKKPVEPFYLGRSLTGMDNSKVYPVAIPIVNSITLWSSVETDYKFVLPYFSRTRNFLVRCIPTKYRVCVPREYGNLGIIAGLQDLAPSDYRLPKGGWQGYDVPYVQLIAEDVENVYECSPDPSQAIVRKKTSPGFENEMGWHKSLAHLSQLERQGNHRMSSARLYNSSYGTVVGNRNKATSSYWPEFYFKPSEKTVHSTCTTCREPSLDESRISTYIAENYYSSFVRPAFPKKEEQGGISSVSTYVLGESTSRFKNNSDGVLLDMMRVARGKGGYSEMGNPHLVGCKLRRTVVFDWKHELRHVSSFDVFDAIIENVFAHIKANLIHLVC